MIDFIKCEIDSVGYDIFKKQFTITINSDFNSIKCYLKETIIEAAAQHYKDHCKCIATVSYFKKKLLVTNIRKLGEE